MGSELDSALQRLFRTRVPHALGTYGASGFDIHGVHACTGGAGRGFSPMCWQRGELRAGWEGVKA